jgi:two-component system NtrC family response regulator
MRRLLIVDDDPGLLKQLKWVFEDMDLHEAQDRASALAALRRFEPGVVLLDLGLPPDPANATEGLAALEEILGLAPQTKVVVVTGSEERDHALQAIAAGACDYYQKPVEGDVLRIIVDRAFHLYELEMENRRLVRHGPEAPLSGIIASSPEMTKVCRMAEKVAGADVTVTVLGESGTGKELLARAVHDLSPRAEGRFVAINCAAIPENLLESELFGFERGAFTGAHKQTPGKIELADKGTLFLDEIGDLPQSLQAKLLRFLQERVIERIGGRSEIPVDVRVVCATNRNLKEMIAEGSFREDLYYRLCEVTLKIPPLRDRPGDVTLLARTLLKRHAAQLRKKVRGFTDDALTAMEAYSWPGNVRELENRIKRAVIMADGATINAEELELLATGESRMPLNLRQIREEAERRAVVRAMEYSGGNVSHAAELLGVSRPTLYDLMARLGLK